MQVTPLYKLTSGCSVAIASDMHMLKVTSPKDHSFFDLRASPPGPLPPDANISGQFRELLSIAGGSDSRAILTIFELASEERLSTEQLELIRKGATYSVGFEAEPELRAIMFFVLEERRNRTTLLGLIDVAPPQSVSKDENLVAMLDLLGFSNIMENYSLDELEERFTSGVLQMLWLVESLSAGVAIFDEHGNMDMPREARRLEYGVISDTLVLYPRNGIEQPLVVLCEAVSLLMDWALQSNWLLRGGIAIGSFRALEGRPIYLGNAIVAAHGLEMSQEWSGCVLAKDVVSRFSEDAGHLLDRGLLVHSSVPFKTAEPPPTASDVVVNWCFYRSGNEAERQRKLQHLAGQASGTAKEKLERTLSFLADMERRGLAGLEPVTLSDFSDPSES